MGHAVYKTREKVMGHVHPSLSSPPPTPRIDLPDPPDQPFCAPPDAIPGGHQGAEAAGTADRCLRPLPHPTALRGPPRCATGEFPAAGGEFPAPGGKFPASGGEFPASGGEFRVER
eukprot:178600-Prorocentrum_minimum.AAC.1